MIAAIEHLVQSAHASLRVVLIRHPIGLLSTQLLGPTGEAAPAVEVAKVLGWRYLNGLVGARGGIEMDLVEASEAAGYLWPRGSAVVARSVLRTGEALAQELTVYLHDYTDPVRLETDLLALLAVPAVAPPLLSG